MKTLKKHKAKATRNTATWLPRSKRGRFFTRLISMMMVMSLILVYPGGALAAPPSIAEYTAYPPFGGKLIKPNVLINLDTSVSLNYFAYDFDFNARTTRTNGGGEGGGSSVPRSEGFTDNYPTDTYYGYFDSDYWYGYGSGEFTSTAPKTGSGLSGARAKNSGEWDGNFLNWLTMRRADIIKKALIGGKTQGRIGVSTVAPDDNDLIGQAARTKWEGYEKYIADAEPYTPLSGEQTFEFDNRSQQRGKSVSVEEVASFEVNNNIYNVVVHQGTLPEGVIQSVGSSVRWGLEFINDYGPFAWDDRGGQ